MCFSPQWRPLFRHRIAIESLKSGPNPRCFVRFHFQMCFAPQQRAPFRHLNFQKSSEPDVFWHFFTSKCASGHNSVHFFNISASKSRLNPTCFGTFYFQMCFGPQQRALFQHFNFQKWSEQVVLLLFDLEMCFAPQRRALCRHVNF